MAQYILLLSVEILNFKICYRAPNGFKSANRDKFSDGTTVSGGQQGAENPFLGLGVRTVTPSRSTNSNIELLFIRNSKKMPTDFSDNANKTSVFVSGWIYAELFSSSLDPIPGSIIQITDWRVKTRSRTQIGSAESPWRLWRSSRSSPGAFQTQKIEIYLDLLSQSQNDETAKRQTMKQRNLLETVNLSTGPSFRYSSGQ